MWHYCCNEYEDPECCGTPVEEELDLDALYEQERDERELGGGLQ